MDQYRLSKYTFVAPASNAMTVNTNNTPTILDLASQDVSSDMQDESLVPFIKGCPGKPVQMFE